jgi:hypothetical protein
MARSTSDDVEPYDDVGDPASIKEKTIKAKSIEERRLAGLALALSTEDGRLFIWRFLESCGLFSTQFNGNSRDFYNLGHRNAGMPMFVDITNNFMEQYLLMAKENKNVTK